MNFWILVDLDNEGKRAVTDFTKADPVCTGKATYCESCGNPISLIPWLPPLHAEVEIWTPCFGDIAFGSGDNLLMKEALADKIRKDGLRGLSGFEPVSIERVVKRYSGLDPENKPEYVRVAVSVSRTALDCAASEAEWSGSRPWCEECKRAGILKRVRRVVINEDTWTGEDIFVARGLYGAFVVTERFYNWFNRNELNNGYLVPADEYGFTYPNSWRQHLEETRANE